ncbi:TPA: hypothetical protein ACGG8I_001437 [Escherichia coli]
MSVIAEVLRSNFIPGLSDISRPENITFKAWIANLRYKISSPIQKKNFILDVYDYNDLIKPFCYDVNRMASASFESIEGVRQETKFPKSFGWMIIRSYYSAYFSAHAILRLYGISCSQMDAFEVSRLMKAAKVYNMDNGIIIEKGYYACKYDKKNNKIQMQQLSNTHQDVWKVFYDLLSDLSQEIAKSDFLKEDRENTIEFLYNLRYRLSHRDRLNSGNWLSQVRNEVNYTHSMGAWFPYTGASYNYDIMYRKITTWRGNLDSIMFSDDHNDEVMFAETCAAIVAMCKGLLEELYNANPKCFLSYGAKKCLNYCNGHDNNTMF